MGLCMGRPLDWWRRVNGGGSVLSETLINETMVTLSCHVGTAGRNVLQGSRSSSFR